MTYGYVKIYFRMILLVQLLVFVYNIYISALFLLRGKAVFENATLQTSLLSGRGGGLTIGILRYRNWSIPATVRLIYL